MDFSLALVAPDDPRPPAESDVDPEELDDFPTLVIVCCGVLASVGYGFAFAGFGRDDWKFDVGYDLSALLEGIPDFAAGITGPGTAEIDMYPQGVEKVLTFTREGGDVRVGFAPRDEQGAEAMLPYAALEEMFADLVRDFAVAVARHAPALAVRPPLELWRTGRMIP